MTHDSAPDETDDIRRKRALYRASYRGTREMDFVLGRFAKSEIATLSGEDLRAFEHLIEAADGDLYQWVVGRTAVPSEYNTDIFRRLLKFHAASRVG